MGRGVGLPWELPVRMALGPDPVRRKRRTSDKTVPQWAGRHPWAGLEPRPEGP